MKKTRKSRKPTKNKQHPAGYESSDNDEERKNVDLNALSVNNPSDILSIFIK